MLQDGLDDGLTRMERLFGGFVGALSFLCRRDGRTERIFLHNGGSHRTVVRDGRFLRHLVGRHVCLDRKRHVMQPFMGSILIGGG